jgi:hypothetical protein
VAAGVLIMGLFHAWIGAFGQKQTTRDHVAGKKSAVTGQLFVSGQIGGAGKVSRDGRRGRGLRGHQVGSGSGPLPALEVAVGGGSTVRPRIDGVTVHANADWARRSCP